METVILLCLLIMIYLLVQDRMVIKKRLKKKQIKEKVNPKLPDIMGQPMSLRRLAMPDNTNERQMEESEVNPDNLDIEYDQNENVFIEIQLEEKSKSTPDWEEEEEEWIRYGIASEDNGFAQGVTFEELSSVGMLLQKERLEPFQKETAIAIVQKIQGTELFSLLENSIESASRQIAELLDGSLSSEIDVDSSTLGKKDLEDFDIGKFV